MTLLTEEYQIRRSTDPAMVPFTRLKLPLPDQTIYREHAKYYLRADQSRVGDGFPTLTWVWDILTDNKLSILLGFLDGNDYADVRVRTEARLGTTANAEVSFLTFDAVMLKPILSGQEGVPVARSHTALQTVSVNFRQLEAV
jgi:hypothetical protein